MSSASSGSIVVKHSAHNPKIKGSNPDAGTGRDKLTEKGGNIYLAIGRGTVVVNLAHNPKIKGLNPASGTRKRGNEGKGKNISQ